MVTAEQVKNDRAVKAYIAKADESLSALGYTEHSFAHVGLVANTAKYILETLGYDAHQVDWPRSPASSTTSAIWSTGWTTPSPGL